jgi:hypothetical protein
VRSCTFELSPDAAKLARRTEARCFRYALDVEVRGRHQAAREFDAKPRNVVRDARAHVLAEEAREMPRAQAPDLRQGRQRPIPRGIAFDRVLNAMNDRLNVIAACEPGGDLRIARRPAAVDDEITRALARDRRACNFADERR